MACHPEFVDLVSDDEDEQPVAIPEAAATNRATHVPVNPATSGPPPANGTEKSLSLEDEEVQAYLICYGQRREALTREYMKRRYADLLGSEDAAASLVDSILDLKIQSNVVPRKLPRKDYQRLRTALRDETSDIQVEAIHTKSSHVQVPIESGPCSEEPKPRGSTFHTSCNISKQKYDEISSFVSQSFSNPKKDHHACTFYCRREFTKRSQVQVRGVPSFLLPLYQGFQRQFVNHSGGKKSYFYVAPCGRRLRNMDEILHYLCICDSKLDVDVFTFDEMRIFLPKKAFSPVRCYSYLQDLSYGKEAQPIPVINSINLDQLDLHKYQYSKERIIDHKALGTISGNEFVSCCSCIDNCQSSDCECKSLCQPLAGRKEDEVRHFPYRYKRLKRSEVTAVFECNNKCPCNFRCPLRVVQHGMKVQVEVFKTARKGWGVRAKQDIPSGSFICTYAAEVLTNSTGESRGDDMYFAALDYIECAEAAKVDYEDAPTHDVTDESDEEDTTNPGALSGMSGEKDMGYKSHSRVESCTSSLAYGRKKLPPRKAKLAAEHRIKKQSTIAQDSAPPQRIRGSLRDILPDREPFVLDAQNRGNVGRFLNHSCQPNCFVQSVFIETHDLRLPHVCVFALSDIIFNEELTWNYNYEVGSVADRQLQCCCGARDCKGRFL